MRLPRLRELWRAAARVALATIALAGVTMLWIYREPLWGAVRSHPYFVATDVMIRGVGVSLSEVDVRTWIGVDTQTSLWDLDPVQVRMRLEAHPLIARAAVRREFPNRVVITVRERRPAAIALLDRYYYVDRDGQVISALGPAHSRDYPFLTGLTVQTSPGHRTWLFRRALRLVRLCDRIGCLGGVSEINVDRDRGLVMYPLVRQAAVVLGWGSWREKLTRVEHVLRTEPARGGSLVIDARHRNQIVIQRQDVVPDEQLPLPARRGMAI